MANCHMFRVRSWQQCRGFILLTSMFAYVGVRSLVNGIERMDQVSRVAFI